MFASDAEIRIFNRGSASGDMAPMQSTFSIIAEKVISLEETIRRTTITAQKFQRLRTIY